MPEGESLQHVLDRAWPAFARACDGLGADDTLLVVAHDAVNRVLLCRVLGMPLSRLWAFRQAPTTLNLLEGAGCRSPRGRAAQRLQPPHAVVRRSGASRAVGGIGPAISPRVDARVARPSAARLQYRHAANACRMARVHRAPASANPSTWAWTACAKSPRAWACKRPAKKVITVAGTNGKGSTVAFIEAIARAAGWKVGAYTSPHLLRYNERVRIDGADAGDAELVAAFEAVEAARGDTPLTYFEYGTLAALWLFERSELDLAILEVGLGGRLDAVNLVDADVAVITTVDLDHQDWLGDDREAIGFEKAGIARAWKPLVLGEDDPPSSVLRHAYAIGASAIRAGCDFFFEPHATRRHWRWREVGYSSRTAAADAGRAGAAAQRRRPRSPRCARWQIEAADAAMAEGVANAHVAGRLQRFERDGRRDRGRRRPQPAGGARTGGVAGGGARCRAHARGVRRAGRQGRGGRGRRRSPSASTPGTWPA